MKKKISQISRRLEGHRLLTKVLFFATGIAATIWFLIRVIPKPSRAAYPCMRIAAPVMSGFAVYLLSLGGFALFIKKARQNFLRARYFTGTALLFAALVTGGVFVAHNAIISHARVLNSTGPGDGPNQPMGVGDGVNPGRVVWVWNPEATNAECINIYDLFKPENTNQGVVNKMVVDGIQNLGGKSSLSESWDVIFRSFNYKKSKSGRGYTAGEKIFIKINQGTANGRIRSSKGENIFDVPTRFTESQKAKQGKYGTCETYPTVILEILRELVYVLGIDQKDISIGDPIAHIFGHNYKVWATEFPDVVYVDRSMELEGRTLIYPTENDLIFYSDHTQRDKLYDVIENANYLINVANLKPHGRAGISLTAKNHYGSHARKSAVHLHYSLISPVAVGNPSNGGYMKYRTLVDIMGSKYLGQNTLLYVVDGLYGGGSMETGPPVKYFMPPFNNDWSNSIFLSQDQVALESVCYDFIRSEWNGTYAHSQANNKFEDIPSVRGIDDYLHQAADSANWPEGLIYDPDNSGKALGSLGVHEHWNSVSKKQYSRNLGLSHGIELVSVPDTLVGSNGLEVSSSDTWLKESTAIITARESISSTPETITKPERRQYDAISRTFDGAFKANSFHAVLVDDENTKWFLCDAGIVSFDGKKWALHNENRRIPALESKDVAFDFSDFGRELWLASPSGACVATIPIDARSGATSYYAENSPIISENVLSVAVGKGSLRWFGTDKGISAFHNDKWLTPAYERKYPEYMFEDFPITSMATSLDGDSLYVGTLGAGVSRVYRNDVDGITGASEYAQWGSIELPSDSVLCIFISADGTQWFGTPAGAARHTGYETLDNWTVFNKESGLIDNRIQAIAVDFMGCVWFGTPKGLGFYFPGSTRNFTEKDGLSGNNIQCMAVDRDGIVWLGTDKGVTSYSPGEFTKYQNQD